MTIQVNDSAPDFELPDQDNKKVRLSDFTGQHVLLYFYPKDDTPGCTKEACLMQEHLPRFDETKMTVLGISPDDVASHRRFANKYKLSFRLLADTEKKVIQAYGAWGLKKFMGKEYMGVLRSSVLIGPHGKVVKVYPKVDPEKHSSEVLADLQHV